MIISYNDLKRIALLDGLSLRLEDDRFLLKCIDGKTNFDNEYESIEDVLKDMVNYGKERIK